jgi:hypothetical protein
MGLSKSDYAHQIAMETTEVLLKERALSEHLMYNRARRNIYAWRIEIIDRELKTRRESNGQIVKPGHVLVSSEVSD